jgi:6-phosphogluconate dehydrogenase
MVGLGVMGCNLVLNMADRGFSVVGYDNDQTKVEAIRMESAKNNVRGVANILGSFKCFVSRAILMIC